MAFTGPLQSAPSPRGLTPSWEASSCVPCPPGTRGQVEAPPLFSEVPSCCPDQPAAHLPARPSPSSPSCCYELACVPCLRFRSSRVDREPVCPRPRWGGGRCGGVWGGGRWAFLVAVREGGSLAVPGALGAAALCAQVFSIVHFSLVTCHVIKCLLFCLETF